MAALPYPSACCVLLHWLASVGSCNHLLRPVTPSRSSCCVRLCQLPGALAALISAKILFSLQAQGWATDKSLGGADTTTFVAEASEKPRGVPPCMVLGGSPGLFNDNRTISGISSRGEHANKWPIFCRSPAASATFTMRSILAAGPVVAFRCSTIVHCSFSDCSSRCNFLLHELKSANLICLAGEARGEQRASKESVTACSCKKIAHAAPATRAPLDARGAAQT